MKRKFTFLMAAFMLLALFVLPMKAWATDGDILNETFEDGSSTVSSWSFNTVSGHESGYGQIDNNSSNAHGGSKFVHLGSGSNAYGSATTPTLSAMTENATMTFWAKTNTNNHSLKLSATGCTIDQTSIVIANGTWTQYTVNITNGTSSAKINFYKDGSTKKYIYIDDVVITSVSGGGSSLTPNDLTLNATEKEFDLADGENQTFQLTNSGIADGALSFESNNTAVATVNSTGLITAIGEGTATITVTQAATSTYEGGTATCTVTVTDSRYSVSELTFAAACGGTGTASTSDQAEWTITSDGTESSFDNNKGIHYGTGSAEVQYIQLSTSDISGTIGKIIVNTSTANGVTATVGVTVGGSAFGGDAQSISSTPTNYTFTGNAQGEIVVTVTKPSSATGALYVKSVKVSYIPSTDPNITADDVDIEYDATGGNIAYTIHNEPNPAGTLTAAVKEGTTPTIANFSIGTVTNSTVTFSCSSNTEATERMATVTLTYTYGENQIVTKDVVITQAAAPVIYSTIPEIFAAATNIGGTASNVNVTFGNWVVSGVSGSNAFVTDNNGNGFIIYKSNHGFTVNDKLSGTVMETPLKLYNGSAEFTNLTDATDGLSTSNDGTITVITNKTIADLVGVNTGAVITLSNLTYDGTNLSDGTNTIKPYNTLFNSMSFSNGKTYNVTGVYQQYTTNNSDTKEILPRSAADIEEVIVTTPSIIVTPASANVTAAGGYPEFAVSYENLTIADENDFAVEFFDSDGTTVASQPSWITDYEFNSGATEGYELTLEVDENTDVQRVAYLKAFAFDNVTPVYSNLITITQAAPVLDYATLPFVWAGGTSGELTALNGVTGNSLGDYAAGNAPYRVQFNATGDYILIKTNEQPAVVRVDIKKVGGAGNSSITISGSANGEDFIEVETFSNNDGAQNALLTHITSNAFATTDRYVKISFTKPSGGTNIGVGPITIRGIETYPAPLVVGYGDENEDSKLGYRLIASPVTVDPDDVEGMTEGNFDLYWFDQTAGAATAWQNYEAAGAHFDLIPGMGYLYAHNTDITLTFTGVPYVGDGTVSLVKDTDDSNVLSGWNLIGNPFGVSATITNDYYTTNAYGDEIVAGSGQIAATQAVFVLAEHDGDEVTFTKVSEGSNNNNSGINLNLSQTVSTRGSNSGVIDRAIVRFGEGSTLPKFQLFQGSTKLYIPQNGKDYAVVRSEARGEMPVNFKAAENGTYTISVETENLEVNYLHLIDNMTGMDVDLLATPSYTFEGKKSDYASRFKLVFNANAGNNEVDEDFAFISDGNIIILNEGEATLQVIDIMGRIVNTQTVNGNASVNNVGTAGVYVLQLINGNNVKTQKIVIK